MSTLDHNEPEGEKILASHGPKPEEIDASAGYEKSDVGITGLSAWPADRCSEHPPHPTPARPARVAARLRAVPEQTEGP